MSNTVFINVLRFVLLVITQVLIFNNLNFLGFINPMVYVIFFYWYPIKRNRAIFMLTAFLLGLVIDVFSDSLALNALASVTIAYARPAIMRFCFGVNYDFQNFSFKNTTKLQRITFMALLIFIHHLIFFSFEILSIAHILLILKKVFATGTVTLILCVLFSSLFSPKSE
ncbi:MAG TPA: rod shape-determining protein MreD [Muricauda sp.]|uniref:Rod shape-determining protein MreD n=1 Tax=Flagellimonas aurea TaxID=2915619 RepID=A0ABS3G7F9_9FLAO|nr:rod shape-determining protein MreD [Allomuricauda aurea]MAO17923.1 rod shape-determining protein MreD [Allomuricauda sp.]UBZ15311.1 rod shape-determining protein MreD [Allomuricauda aquimarina]MBC73091.1 rod shape-determining protein MreD [Allomuricauda sp.]MBO0355341.1 rod shape-determining protein MreD [Allomuricauda aurea]HBU79608.1 rod shape-determining protein MreD [Allomuricauda sp.]|tara:strand:+ start:299 stop:805 length:507 start_codon:yes stop_codon:yes gene_type:complete